MLKDLEEQAVDWKEIIRILVPANKVVTFRLTRQRFKLKDKDELRVNLRHLTHYILAWIVYIDNIYDMHKNPKEKNRKYLIRIYQAPDKRQFRNAKYIYSQHPTEV